MFAILFIALIGGLLFLLFWLIRKYVRFRRAGANEERLRKEVEKLNVELYQTIQEKDRILGLQVHSMGAANVAPDTQANTTENEDKETEEKS